jgi:hypothetical protein
LSTRSARASGVAAQALDDVGTAEQQAGLGTAQQLVAAGRDDSSPCAQGCLASGSSGSSGCGASRPAADVGDDRCAEAREVPRPPPSS